VLFAIATVGVLAVGAHAASAASIEICKAGTNGQTGVPFQFSVNGGAPITVNGGRCSGSIPVSGTATITENTSNPPTDVSAIQVRPSIWQVSQNLPGRSVTINTGTSSSSGLVTFTNEPAGGNYGTLKICKVTSTPGFIGSLFSFQVGPVGGPLGPAVSTPANDGFADESTWSCTILGTFQVGSNVTVHEQIPGGVQVLYIDTEPGTALGQFDTTAGNANVTVGAGVTEVLFDDEPVPTSQTGYLEVCKEAALINGSPDPAVSGPFNFTVVDSNGTTYQKTVNVPSPNYGLSYCTPPFVVAAGLATVTEQQTPGFQLDDIYTIPANAQVGENITNGTTTVDVPVTSDQNQEVQVHFVNEHARGQLKICKALGPNSSDLAGMTFYFNVVDVTDPSYPVTLSSTFPVTAGQCTIFGYVPIGDTINVTENLDRTTAPGSFIDTSGEGPVTIASGINTVTITNTARGNLEICKRLTSTWTAAAPTFQFRVDGGAVQTVTASINSGPLKCITLRVSVGAHTVTEVNSANFELDSSRTDGGISVLPASAEISRSLANRSVTVNVPFAGDTTTIFSNRIRQFLVKICKLSTPGSVDALSSVLFNYNWAVDGQGSGTLFPVANAALGLHIGECAFVSDGAGNPVNFNVIGPSGNPASVTVGEINASNASPPPFGSYYVSKIQVFGSRGAATTNCLPEAYSPTGQQCFFLPNTTNHVKWTPGPGVNEADFTNTAGG
jgi:hypothetical protein